VMAEVKLLGMFESFDRLVTEATREQWSCTDFLDAMLQAESDFRGERKTKRRIKAAKFALTFTTWPENLALARSAGTYLKFRDKCAKPDAAILDDFGMRKLTATEAQDLCELLEELSIDKSTVLTTQLPLEHCGEVIVDPVISDAIRDRLEHSALRITAKAALRKRWSRCTG